MLNLFLYVIDINYYYEMIYEISNFIKMWSPFSHVNSYTCTTAACLLVPRGVSPSDNEDVLIVLHK